MLFSSKEHKAATKADRHTKEEKRTPKIKYAIYKYYPAFVSTSCICIFAGIPPPYPPFDCIWFWIELTEFIPLKRSPDPTWAVCTKFVGSPIMLLSILLRRFGWGCSAIQQLKHSQNSLIVGQEMSRDIKSKQSWPSRTLESRQIPAEIP